MSPLAVPRSPCRRSSGSAPRSPARRRAARLTVRRAPLRPRSRSAAPPRRRVRSPARSSRIASSSAVRARRPGAVPRRAASTSSTAASVVSSGTFSPLIPCSSARSSESIAARCSARGVSSPYIQSITNPNCRLAANGDGISVSTLRIAMCPSLYQLQHVMAAPACRTRPAARRDRSRRGSETTGTAAPPAAGRAT